ncbi:radical SAM protein [Bradyrhizobium sediminis]|uniref:Radical SAM protein n=1 Tax=Bradyrhizobium sediminis TaxID=2840469 RepID=A0A975RP27_9BRAD|nr:radical SAM protein [Bradyrhizobium sediminis]QWG14176.1 radical SAM protein [Bradyrhizobium sediminis]
MKVKSLTILVTLRCPASCAHCAVHSSPRRREKIEPGLARQAVEEAAASGLNIVLSGGEAMLCPTLVFDLATRASLHGVSVAVYTNGFWATTPARAERMTQSLTEAGVDCLLLSTDAFHLPFVPVTRVENACRAAAATGMTVEVAVPSRPADREAAAALARLRRIPGVLVRSHGIARAGRAANLELDNFCSGIPDAPCHVLGQLALGPDGTLYACCAAAIGFGPASPLCAGRFGERSLAQLIARLDRRILLDDIQTEGPLRAAFHEARRNPAFSFEFAESYTDQCAACRAVCAAYGEGEARTMMQGEVHA